MQVAPTAMEQDAQIVMRVPQEMADRLKEYAAKLTHDFGVPVSTAAAARRLLAEGLDREGLPVKPATDKPAQPRARKKR